MQANSISDLERQVKLSKMLAMGFALSLVGAGGLGSLAALLIGLKALTVINRGADDAAGPNYTGQAAVNSHYDRLEI